MPSLQGTIWRAFLLSNDSTAELQSSTGTNNPVVYLQWAVALCELKTKNKQKKPQKKKRKALDFLMLRILVELNSSHIRIKRKSQVYFLLTKRESLLANCMQIHFDSLKHYKSRSVLLVKHPNFFWKTLLKPPTDMLALQP